MKQVRNLAVQLLGLIISVALSITVMIKGWGLEPQSWGWIIGVGVFGHIAVLVIMILGEED